MATDHKESDFHYDGFSSPNGTIVPDDVFDVLMPRLTDPELRVLLYIIRRTFGFKKTSDDISLKQMVEGIRMRDGTVLDGGTGMSKASVARGLKGLAGKGIITVTHNSSRERGNEPTTYALRFRNGGLSHAETRGVSQHETRGRLKMRQARVSPVDPQQTVQQQTEISSSKIRKTRVKKTASDEALGYSEQSSPGQDSTVPTPIRDTLQVRFPRSGTQPGSDIYDEDRQTLIDYLADFAREFGDRAALKSTVTRVARLYERSGLERQVFIEQMYRARAITKERSGSIRSGKFAYFLTVLEDLVGLREDDEPSAASQ